MRLSAEVEYCLGLLVGPDDFLQESRHMVLSLACNFWPRRFIRSNTICCSCHSCMDNIESSGTMKKANSPCSLNRARIHVSHTTALRRLQDGAETSCLKAVAVSSDPA